MHLQRETARRTASFVFRIWWEEGDSGPVWRGWTQHAASGDSCYFQTVAELLRFVERHAGNLGLRSEDWGA